MPPAEFAAEGETDKMDINEKVEEKDFGVSVERTMLAKKLETTASQTNSRRSYTPLERDFCTSGGPCAYLQVFIRRSMETNDEMALSLQGSGPDGVARVLKLI